MRDLARIRNLARQLAQPNATHKRAPKKFDLTAVVKHANLSNISPLLWDEFESHLDHKPALGLAMARVLHAIAKRRRKPRARATADLALIRALNVCGEFFQATQLCADAARRFEKLCDIENVAHVWLEAAWAETYLGNLEAAEKYLEQASGCSDKSRNSESEWRADWIRARILRERGAYQDALDLFTRVRAAYVQQGAKHAAMRVLRELGHTLARMNPSAALKPLKTARAFFVRTNCPIEIAHCDYFIAQALIPLNRFRKASIRLFDAQGSFRKQEIYFFESMCNLDLGYLCWYLNRFEEMLNYSQRAYALFLELQATQELATCQINIGVALMELNRYAEAIPYFESVMSDALASGRQTKAATCLLNLAQIYDTQGEYAFALEHLQHARAILSNASRKEFLITCELRLAYVYLQLNDLGLASASIESAHHLAVQEKMTTRLAQCELYRAQVFLLQSQFRNAAAALRRARTHFARNNQTSHVALCDRLLAGIPSQRRTTALARLANSRAMFRQQRQFVDVALCDLTRGELYLRWCDWNQASVALSQARRVLQENFPEQHARILYGLGRIAQAQKQPQRALQHLIQAAQTLAQVRRTLGIESLSNSFFGARQRFIQDGLRLARNAHAPESALALIEAAKAQTFSQVLPTQAWRLSQADERVRELEKQERALYDRLVQQRQKLAVRVDVESLGATRSDPAGNSPSAKLRALTALTADYEHVAQELRLARRSLVGVPVLDPFSLATFRVAASSRWGDAWLALDYYFDKDWLYLVSVDSTQVNLNVRRWGWYEQQMLQQATHLHPEMRELVFNGTLRGQSIPPRENPLVHLGETLLPPQAQELAFGATLLIAPHQLLHQLPFQALQLKGQYLATRVAVAYTPTLQAYTQVCENAPRRFSDKALVCGAQTFEGNLRELKHTRREVSQIQRQFAGATVLWQDQITRDGLMEWNQAGRLREFPVLHFATHATVQVDAPHSSAIRLGKEELTVLDITTFVLDARLVTLSACSSNIGKGGSGDEWVSLARVFFYAGARALVASLWQVDDKSTTKLMGLFYKSLSKGETISEALRSAQLELIRTGATPYQWAAFVAVGNV